MATRRIGLRSSSTDDREDLFGAPQGTARNAPSAAPVRDQDATVGPASLPSTSATAQRPSASARQKQNLEDAISEDAILPFPPDLHDDDRELWTRLVNTRTREFWSLADIELLRMYCRCARDIKRLNDELEHEGEVIYNDKGTAQMNPKIVARNYAEGRLITLASRLTLQPASRPATIGKDMERKAKAEEGAELVSEDDDELLNGFQNPSARVPQRH